MNLALAQRIGVSAPPTLPRKVANILKKFGSDAHLYTFGPGVPILGPELVTSGTISLSAGAQQAVTGSTIITGKTYVVSIPSGVLMAITSGWSVTGNGTAQTVVANGSGQAQVYSAGGVSNFTPTIKEILGYSNTYSGFVAGNYFDSAGTTHASVDGSVGLVLDAAGGVGAELVTNGDFSSDTWWNKDAGVAIGGGACSFSAAANGVGVWKPNLLVVNKYYQFTYTIVSVSAGGFKAMCGNTSGATRTAPGTYTEIIQAVSTVSGAVVASGTTTGVIDNISIKEVTGIHATQSTPGFKPTLRKGIVNLLKSSNDLTSADWLKTNATVGAAVADPDGGMNAKKVSFVYGAGPITRLYQDYGTAVNGAKYTFPIWLRSDTPCQMLLGVQRSGPADVEQTVIDITASWQLFVFSHSGVFTGSSAVRGVLSSAVPGFSADVEVYRPGLFQGTLTAAQILAAGGIPLTTTAPASSQAGVNYAEFDGIDDRLGFSAPLFQLADDHTVIVGAKNLSSGNLTLFEVGDGSSTARVCSMRVNSNNFNVLWNDGTTSASAYTAESTSGVSFVATGQRLGNSFKCRRNSGAWASATAMLNPTVSTTTAIGNRTVAASYEFHKGPIYCVLAIKGTVSDADLAVLEKFVAQLSGVQL